MHAFRALQLCVLPMEPKTPAHPLTPSQNLAKRSARWFDRIPASRSPWTRWLDALPAPHLRGNNPLHGKIESRIERLIRDADHVCLSIVPETKYFEVTWAALRRYHESREHDHLSRRLRYLVWRGAALTLICWRDQITCRYAR
jgi:hypothetical protein